LSVLPFSHFSAGFGCAVHDSGGARIALWVEGASINREATADELRQHALTLLAAAEVAEGIAKRDEVAGLPTEGAE
jgi:hypothetical protein